MPHKVEALAPCSVSFGIASDTSSVANGENVTRTITVKNTGRTLCKNVSFSLYYSPNETFVSSNPKARAGNYYFVIGNLQAGAQSVTTVVTKAQIVDGTSIDTEGCATATGASDSCATGTVSITNSQTTITPSPVVTPSTGNTSTPTTTPVVTPTPTPVPTSSQMEQGTWIWNFPGDMLSTSAQSQLRQLSSYGFNAVYITIDDYLDIASMPAGIAKDAAKETYFNNLSTFIKNANALGMQVDAEGGWRDWAKQENRWKGFALIDAVKEYNSLHPEAKLRGFQYDVEPYLLPEYEGDKAPVLLDFVTFIDQSVQRFSGSDIAFSLSIPHFYDDVNQWTPTITYGGATTYTYNHLLRILEKKPGSTILLMSYRNFFEGTNGTRAISETEVKEASAGYHTKVIVGQETGNVDPSYVTFYGDTKTNVLNAAKTITTAFKGYGQYGGVAIHYMDSFLAMSN